MRHKDEFSFYNIIVVGAGFSGLGAAIRLQKEKMGDFVIFERAADIGGTWRENTYPGCGCDVPSRLYSYSFELNPSWSRIYSRQLEILNYLKQCVHKNNLYEKINFNTEIVDIHFDEESGLWTVKTNTGKVYKSRFIISATGRLTRPKIPQFTGLKDFSGTYFHSACWPKNFDIKGRNVAVIGTGASAIQIVPSIVNEVEKLVLFQRSPPWILPKRDTTVSAIKQKVYKHVSFFERVERAALYYFNEIRGNCLWGNNSLNKLAETLGKRHLEKSVSDPALREKLRPNYTIGCKQILLSSEFYPAIQQDNVFVETEHIEAIVPEGIYTKNGQLHKVDTIVFATGFYTSGNLVNFPVKGLQGLTLKEQWERTGHESYYGISVSGFPNYFFMVGPNTGLGHNSTVVMIEAQMNYILDYIRQVKKTKAKYLNVKLGIQEKFNASIQERLKETVWGKDCQSWYVNKAGKNTTLWPGSTIKYRNAVRNVQLKDFEIIGNQEKILDTK